jgi:DNA-directed RNA polymerase specialized sigma24 family protein
MISESDLVEGCRAGDRKLQKELYERYAPKMFGVCLRYAGATEEAEDILQEGFVKVFNKEEQTVESDYLSVLDNLAEKDIIGLVQRLSPGYRSVFNLYVVEGYTHKQIGELMGISEGTSKSQLSRAKSILQDLVRKHLDEKQKLAP